MASGYVLDFSDRTFAQFFKENAGINIYDGRGAVYCLPGAAIPKPEEVFGAGSEQFGGSSAHLEPSSAHLPEPTSGITEQRDIDGCLLSDQLDAPVIDSLDRITPDIIVDPVFKTAV
ncbi:MAG: hypothetical protein Q8P42_16710 [Gallionella sp.]|nr:hypothetical protein [Gallionella sp.]